MAKAIRILHPKDLEWAKIVRAANGKTESLSSMKSRTAADVRVNVGVFTLATGAPECYLYLDGKWQCRIGNPWGLAVNGTSVEANYDNGQKRPQFIGCYHELIHKGIIKISTTKSEHLVTRRGHTGIGIRADKGIVLYACKDGSDALNLPELAQKLLDLGCDEGFNYDGGASSGMITPDATMLPDRYISTALAFKYKTTQKEDKPVGVNQYSKKADGGLRLTLHFKVSEFACRDGSDKILIDSALVAVLEDIRAACGNKPVNVTSGYRTPAYNSTVGGAPASYHLKGMAADITIPGVSTETICKAAEAALKKRGIQGGIGRYVGQGFVHVDVRPVRSRFQQDKKGQAVYSVAGWDGSPAPSMPTIRRGAKGDAVKVLQTALNTQNKAGLKVDSDFGALTEKAVLAFQRAKGLVVDGVVGPKTWGALGL